MSGPALPPPGAPPATSLLTLPGRPPATTAPLGTWLKLPAVEPAQMMARAGFDLVVIDLEHAPLTLETAYRLVTVSALAGMAPLVRVPDHGASTIQRVLDMGAHGVLVPRVDTAEQARAVVRSVRFPPHGDRGSGGTSRAGDWGLLPAAQYRAFGDTAALCVPQLESAAAVAAAADVLAVDGVDAVFVGAADLALSLGVAPGAEAVTAAVARVLELAAAAGKPCGLAFGADGGAGARAVGRGAGFVVLGNDTGLLATAARDLATGYRSALG